MREGAVGVLVAVWFGACGGATDAATSPSAAPTAVPRGEALAPVPSAPAGALPSPPAPPALSPTDVVMSEASFGAGKGDGPQPLETLFGVDAGGFPTPKFDDVECKSQVGLTGDAARDYDSLASACGVGAGLRTFTKKVLGKLDAASHPTEMFAFTMLAKFCYRMFLIGDDTLTTLNVRMERPNGALLAVMSGKHNVVLVEPKDLWCADDDEKFRVVLSAFGREARQGPSPSPQVLALDLRRAKSGAMAPLTSTTSPPHTTPITAAKNALTSHFTRPAAPGIALAAASAAL
jgi:hypothetical protein